MAKGKNYNGKPKKSYSYSPYDASNSFVKRMTNRVSELLPQPSSWISKWFSQSEQPHTGHNRQDQEDDDDDQVQLPSKRMRMSTSVNDFSHQNNIGLPPEHRQKEFDVSPILKERPEEPVAGPSGLHVKRKDFFVSSTPSVPPQTVSQESQTPEKINGDDGSDSSDSTSGCSSLVPQSNKAVSFSASQTLQTSQISNLSTSSIGFNRTPKSLFLSSRQPQLERSSSFNRRGLPTFDASTFHSSVKSGSLNNTSIRDEVRNSSPFYKGRTRYGGAASCKESLMTPMTPLPKVPQIIPVVPQSSRIERDTIGSTAQKILQALEKFSTPVLDAKRMPMKPLTPNSKKRKLQPYAELSIPQVPDLLRIKRKESQQKQPPPSPLPTVSTSTATLTVSSVSSSSSTISTAPSTVTTVVTTTTTSATEAKTSTSTSALTSTTAPSSTYSFREDLVDEGQKHVGSIKGKKKGELESELPVRINLPNVSLPLSSLPVINISLPKPPVSKGAPTATKPGIATSTVTIPSTTPKFTFSEPINQHTFSPSSIQNLDKSSKFKFSEPLEASSIFQKSNVPAESKSSLFKGTSPKMDTSAHKMFENPVKNSATYFNAKAKPFFKPKEGISQGPQPTFEFKTGSVMDVFNSKKSVEIPVEKKDSLVSQKCLKCNNNNIKGKDLCNSCETVKDSRESRPDFVTPFKSSSEKWVCEKCLVRNNSGESKCSSCGQLKTTKAPESSKPNSTSDFKLLSSGAGLTFKPPADSWECQVCLVRNSANHKSCAACSNPNPPSKTVNSIQEKGSPSIFKIPDGVGNLGKKLSQSNDSSASTTTNLGAAKPKEPSPVFSFGMPQTTEAKKEVFTFGVSSNSESKTDVKPSTESVISNKEAKNETQPTTFKFGTSDNQFKFKPVEESKSEKEKGPTENMATTGQVLFGGPNTSETSRQPITATNSSKVLTNSRDEPEDAPPKKKVTFEDKSLPLAATESKSSESKSVVPVNFNFGSSAPKLKAEALSNLFETKPTLFGNCNLNILPNINSTIFNLNSTSTATVTPSTPAEATVATPTSEPPKTTAPALLTFPTTNALTSAGTGEKKSNLFCFSAEKTKPLGHSQFNAVNTPEPPKVTTFTPLTNTDTTKASGGTSSTNETKNVFGSSSETKPIPFGIGGTEETKPNMFGTPASTESKPSFFGSNVMNENKSMFGTTSEGWGAKPTFNANPEVGGTFGVQPAVTTVGFSGFGSTTQAALTFSSNEAAPQTTPFTFNSLPNQSQSASSLFTFKGEGSEKKSSGFIFGAPATTQSGGFSFSAPQTTIASNPSPAGFQPSSFGPASTAPTPSLFGSPSVFGTPAPAASPFSFGAPQQAEQAPVFGFSSAQPQTTTITNTTNFLFGAQAAPAPAPTPSFDPTIKPTFNFTGGATPSFSASPNPALPIPSKPERKIRKAIRRTQNK